MVLQANIYGLPSLPSKPNTATLDMPTQYTASGSISVIPVTAIGQEITYTTVIPGATIPPSIVSAVTAIATTADESPTTIVSTEAESTIPGSTIAPHTSTVTTRVVTPSATAKGLASISESITMFMLFALFFGYVLTMGFT